MRMLLMGLVKTGKTSFLASVPRMLTVDAENKLQWVHKLAPGSSVYTPEARNGKTILEDVEALFKVLVDLGKSGKRPYDLIAIDTVDEFVYRILIPGLTSKLLAKDPGKVDEFNDVRGYGQGGKGWDLITGRMLGYLWDLSAAGYGWIVTGHYKEEKVNLRTGSGFTEITKLRPAVNPGTYNGIFRAAEILARTSVDTVVSHQVVPVMGADGSPVVRNGVPLTKREEVKTTVYSLRPSAKDPGSEELLGNNLGLPAEINVSLGDGWSALVTAFEQTRAHLLTKETINAE